MSHLLDGLKESIRIDSREKFGKRAYGFYELEEWKKQQRASILDNRDLVASEKEDVLRLIDDEYRTALAPLVLGD